MPRLIDADALKKRAAMHGHAVRPLVTAYHMCVSVKDIDNAPTIEVESVVHGRWESEHETWGRLQCSVCKKEALLEEAKGDVGRILLYVTSNYCPNCGAKMCGGAE